MRMSARNRLPGIVRNVRLGGVMAQVDIAAGDNEVTAVITRDAAEELELKEGDRVFAVIKSTDVMVEKSESGGGQ
ncbi:MAG TPA: molybdenum-pterin-binding protein [Chloroflexi bacterium]|nr:molybdenum-pterin-binding protein [Chloroflexota bacterium]